MSNLEKVMKGFEDTPTCSPTMQEDVYKNFHPEVFDKDITEVYINFTNRSGRLSNTEKDLGVVHVGLQAWILNHLIREWGEGFFGLPWEEAISNHKAVMSSILGGEVKIERYKQLHDLGYLPLKIKSLPEGTITPYGVATLTVRNTHPDFAWLPNKLETALSSDLWGISTSATTSLHYMKTAKEYFEKTGKPQEVLPFMCHDFSARGMFGRQAGAMSGFGHLSSGFAGTDTTTSVLFAQEFYGADVSNELVGASVNATEHSTVTSGVSLIQRELEDTGRYNGKTVEDLWFGEGL